MEKVTKLSDVIQIDPVFLREGNLNQTIKDVLEKMYIGKCTRENGYILEILKILSYETTVISPVSVKPSLNVNFVIKNIKPEIGMRTKAFVHTVERKWILATVQKKIKIMISYSELKKTGFSYDEIGVRYKKVIDDKKNDKKNDKKIISIRQSDIISLEISNISQDFICIGKNIQII